MGLSIYDINRAQALKEHMEWERLMTVKPWDYASLTAFKNALNNVESRFYEVVGEVFALRWYVAEAHQYASELREELNIDKEDLPFPWEA